MPSLGRELLGQAGGICDVRWPFGGYGIRLLPEEEPEEHVPVHVSRDRTEAEAMAVSTAPHDGPIRTCNYYALEAYGGRQQGTYAQSLWASSGMAVISESCQEPSA